MGSGGKALGMLSLILAAGGIGFSYFVWTGQNTSNSVLDDLTDQLNDIEADFDNLTEQLDTMEAVIDNLTRSFVVGLWDDISKNKDYAPHNLDYNWLLEFSAGNLTDPDYISVSNDNTRITLLQSGWYRIHLSLFIYSITADNYYYLSMLKDGSVESNLDWYETSATDDGYYHYFESSAFVYSNGTSYIEFNALSNIDSFGIGGNDYNQFLIEYIS